MFPKIETAPRPQTTWLNKMTSVYKKPASPCGGGARVLGLACSALPTTLSVTKLLLQCHCSSLCPLTIFSLLQQSSAPSTNFSLEVQRETRPSCSQPRGPSTSYLNENSTWALKLLPHPRPIKSESLGGGAQVQTIF